MKKKKWIGLGIALVLVLVVIAAGINVNKRFPQRTKEVYAPGEWMPLESGAGYVRIWAKEKPEEAVVIPTILCQ